MAFKVRLFPGAPDYETLHVAKLTCFPLETRDYRPYSQARICFAADGLHLQLLSFEAEPLPDSRIEAALQFAQGQPALVLSLRADGGSEACLTGPVQKAVDGVSIHRFTGEDLQGIYWGGNLIVPFPVLEDFCGSFSPAPGSTFRGNFYKVCQNPLKPHYGCYFPANFSLAHADAQNLGEFLVIDY